MSLTMLLSLIAIGILLASPAWSQSPENAAGRGYSVRPVTITTAGGRTYVVGVQRYVIEPATEQPETPAPAPRKATPAKDTATGKSSP